MNEQMQRVLYLAAVTNKSTATSYRDSFVDYILGVHQKGDWKLWWIAILMVVKEFMVSLNRKIDWIDPLIKSLS